MFSSKPSHFNMAPDNEWILLCCETEASINNKVYSLYQGGGVLCQASLSPTGSTAFFDSRSLGWTVCTVRWPCFRSTAPQSNRWPISATQVYSELPSEQEAHLLLLLPQAPSDIVPSRSALKNGLCPTSTSLFIKTFWKKKVIFSSMAKRNRSHLVIKTCYHIWRHMEANEGERIFNGAVIMMTYWLLMTNIHKKSVIYNNDQNSLVIIIENAAFNLNACFCLPKNDIKGPILRSFSDVYFLMPLFSGAA